MEQIPYLRVYGIAALQIIYRCEIAVFTNCAIIARKPRGSNNCHFMTVGSIPGMGSIPKFPGSRFFLMTEATMATVVVGSCPVQ